MQLLIIQQMAASSDSNISNAGFTLAALTTSTASELTVLAMIYQYLQMYASPVVIVNALVGNMLIIFLTLTTNFFSIQTSFTVRAYYLAIAVADLLTVLSYNLILWLGVCKLLKITLKL